MAAILATYQHRRIRRERVFRDHSQVLDTYSDRELISRYRFDRDAIWSIINNVSGDIKLPSERGGHVIPPHMQVLVTLRFLAKGSFLSETADLHGISKSSASRIIPRVCSALIKHYPVRNSKISEDLSRQQTGCLLGDSGYPLQTWLMTPYIHANEPHQRRYNIAHASTRNVVERSFGVLKARFRCLDKSGGHLCYQPSKAVLIIAACFSLHNIAMEKNMPVPDCDDTASDHDNDVCGEQPFGRAHEIRNNIARRF